MKESTTDFYAALFPVNRQEGDSALRQAQMIMLRMLKVVDHICRKHGIRYWLCSGTLLGAVRHKGFIPWDDDLDISMMREDYERFIRVAPEEFPDDMFLQTKETDPSFLSLPIYCKIRDEKTTIQTQDTEYKGEHNGLFVDLFVLDKYPVKTSSFRWQWMLKKYFYTLCYGYYSKSFRPQNKMRKILSWFHPVFVFLMKDYKKRVKPILDRNRQLDDDARAGFTLDIMFMHLFMYKDIFPLKETEFEDGRFFIPNNSDRYLRVCIGDDYMTPPPESQRRCGHLEGDLFWDK